MAGRLPFVRGDIADPDVVGPLVARGGRGRQLRRRVACRPLHPRSGGVPARPASSASTCCSRRAATAPATGRASCRSRPTRSTAPWRRATPPRTTPLAPRSPYAAAKAAGELLVRSYVITHGLDAVVTRGSNTYGPYHHPEKLIPLFITNALDDRPLPLYGDGLQRRDWLYVSDHAAGIDFVLRHGAAGETYNVAGAAERTNREVVTLLLEQLGKPWSLVRRSTTGRATTAATRWTARSWRALGWRPTTTFEDGLASTVDWYQANEAWWRAARSGDWDGWYARQYAQRLATGQARRRAPRATRRPAATDAGRGHRGRAAASAGASSRPSPMPRSPVRPGRSPGIATEFDLDAPDGIGRASTATGPRSWSMPRPGPTSTAARSTRSWRCGATGSPRACWRRPARSAGIDLLVDLDQRGLRRRRGSTATATCRPTRRRRPTRTARPRPRASGSRPPPSPRRRARPSGSPGRRGCSGRPARLPEPDPRRRRAGQGRRRAAPRRRTTSGAPRPTRPTSPRPSSSCWPRTRWPASTTSSTACSRPAPTGRATSSAGPGSRSRSSTSRRPPGSARRGRRAGASWRRRRCRPANRCGSWPDAMADYAPALLRATRGRA